MPKAEWMQSLSCRAFNGLKNLESFYKIDISPEALRNTPDSVLLKQKNFGQKSLREVRKALEDYQPNDNQYRECLEFFIESLNAL